MADRIKVPAGSQSVDHAGCRRPTIVEVIGPAGSGKTTLFRALTECNSQVQAEFLPPIRNVSYLPFFAENILRLCPLLVRLPGTGDRMLNCQELAWMAMLKGWPKLLRKKAVDEDKIILMEQGPIFLMALLSEFGPSSLQAELAQRYWEEVIEQWSRIIDVVIWLDTSDETLIRRIRTRQDEHEVKEETDEEMKRYLARYRGVFERLMQVIRKNNGAIQVYTWIQAINL